MAVLFSTLLAYLPHRVSPLPPPPSASFHVHVHKNLYLELNFLTIPYITAGRTDFFLKKCLKCYFKTSISCITFDTIYVLTIGTWKWPKHVPNILTLFPGNVGFLGAASDAIGSDVSTSGGICLHHFWVASGMLGHPTPLESGPNWFGAWGLVQGCPNSHPPQTMLSWSMPLPSHSSIAWDEHAHWTNPWPRTEADGGYVHIIS